MILSALLIASQLEICRGAPSLPFSAMAPLGETPEERAYSRYEAYPPYCSAPDEMERRAVPPLSRGARDDGSSRLVHVTALVRHGARTPYAGAPAYRCWRGYWDDAETGVWDCDLKTYTSPPATTKEAPSAARGPVLTEGGGLLEEVSLAADRC